MTRRRCDCRNEERVKDLEVEVTLLRASLIEAEFIIERANSMLADLKRDK